MRRTAAAVAAIIAALLSVPATTARSLQSNQLTFEDRVRAQEAIERVYYSHQVGPTRPFEEIMPRAALERKVLTYLKQSAALDQVWHTPVTAEMLQRETERIAGGTRMPDRLRELFAVLDYDPVLIQECLVRATLADRLARNFYAFDARVHAVARTEAEALQADLTSGLIDPWQEHPRRTEALIRRRSGAELPAPDPVPGERSIRRDSLRTVEPAEFDAWLDQIPDAQSVKEDRESFHTRVVLESGDDQVRLATYRVPKTVWDEWWASVSPGLNESSIVTVVQPDASIPDEIGTQNPSWNPDAQANGLESVTASSLAADDTWDNGTLDDLPNPLGGFSIVWTGSRMVLWGGFDGTTYQTGNLYDPATDTWTATSTVGAPSRRTGHTAVWTGSRMVVWGGSSGFAFLATGGRYDPTSDTWTATSTTGAPSERSGHTAIWTGSQMVVWAGWDGSYLNSGGRYDPATDTWMATTLVGAPSARTGPCVVWTGSRMVIWGGGTTGPFASGGRYNPANDTWTATSGTGAPSPRWGVTAVWTGSRMLFWGGWDGASLLFNTGTMYDPLSNTWTATSTAGAPSARRQHTAVWTGSRMVIWGGIGGGNTGGQYDPITGTWTATSTVGAPLERYNHSAVWTGERMLVWGGDIGERNTGGRYDPVSDTWTPISSAGAPSARWSHKAVWTGNQMIIWGGKDDIAPSLDTGARYDPVTDAWSATSMVGAPSNRTSHTAIWTGDRMVVWGGINVGVALRDTGGRYDPATDTWTATSTAGAPSARMEHTAIWTGSRMVVWGGRDFSGRLQSGGQYDLASDTWSATAISLGPSARNLHTAIWTGSRMVVWGGNDAGAHGGYVRSGGRYDPTSNTWTATSLSGAPSAREVHTAIWTGSRMVIWGGSDGSSLQSGGQYDPASDTWTAVSTALAPAAANHTAVWTGSRMVVWGGFGGSYLRSGGRYDPTTNTWTPTSLTGAPSPRQGHTAVWTGSRMVIWGGIGPLASQIIRLRTGGQYVLIQNLPPNALAMADQSIECDSYVGTSTSLDGTLSTDPDGDPLTYTWTGPFPEGGGMVGGPTPTVTLPLGQHIITLTVDDGHAHSSTDDVTIIVSDTTPPVPICPAAVISECSSPVGTPIVVPPVVATDLCDPSPSMENSRTGPGGNASGTYPLGMTLVSFTAADTSGNQGSCSVQVTVQDTLGPIIGVTASPANLWPPNHRMVPVRLTGATQDLCDASPSPALVSVASSEPDDAPGAGDGATVNDVQDAAVGLADLEVSLRAERDGTGRGRIYTVTYSAVDASGNSASVSSLVTVPHDQNGVTEPVDLSLREVPGGTLVEWSDVPGALFYNVIRGDIGQLREMSNSIDLGQVECVENGSTDASTAGREDPSIPAEGRAYFYLVEHNDGWASSYGSESLLKPRMTTSGGCFGP